MDVDSSPLAAGNEPAQIEYDPIPTPTLEDEEFQTYPSYNTPEQLQAMYPSCSYAQDP